MICATAETNRAPFDLPEGIRINCWYLYRIFGNEVGLILFGRVLQYFVVSCRGTLFLGVGLGLCYQAGCGLF